MRQTRRVTFWIGDFGLAICRTSLAPHPRSGELAFAGDLSHSVDPSAFGWQRRMPIRRHGTGERTSGPRPAPHQRSGELVFAGDLPHSVDPAPGKCSHCGTLALGLVALIAALRGSLPDRVAALGVRPTHPPGSASGFPAPRCRRTFPGSRFGASGAASSNINGPIPAGPPPGRISKPRPGRIHCNPLAQTNRKNNGTSS